MVIFFLTRVMSGEYTWAAGILQAVFYPAGLLVVYRFFNTGADAVFANDRSEKDRDNIFLILWISGVLVYSILLLPYASTRYLLPLFPPVVLMFVSYARGVFRDRTKWSRFAMAAVACTAAGDQVVLSHGLIAYFISDDLKNRLQFERSVDYPSAWPIRIEDPGSQAGFYDQFHGYLPYSLSSDPIETIDIYRVKDRAEVRSQE